MFDFLPEVAKFLDYFANVLFRQVGNLEFNEL